MLMSAVVDPSAFDESYFDELYTFQTVDFLKGIQRNGLLIVDSENRLRDALVERVKLLPIKSQQRLGFLIQELLLKKKSKRVIACFISLNNTSAVSNLDLAYHLKDDTGADALVVGKESIETLKSDSRFNDGIVPLSEYKDSDFEKDRQRYENQVGPIDKLSKLEIEDIIIRSVRFTKWLRFYDAYIGSGENTSRFRRGIEYILSLWHEHGFFASQQGIGEVEIYTCTEHVPNDNVNYVNRKIKRELMDRLKDKFPHWWQIKLFVKSDPDAIFHARHLETQYAIVNVERGFDMFKTNGTFKRNFFTLQNAASSHLKECRELPEANVSSVS